MVQFKNGHSNQSSYSKEPQFEVSSAWEGGDADEQQGVSSVKGERSRGEYWLWQSVVAQALQDAASASKDRKMKSVKAEAIAWFSMNNDAFLYVCELAGLCAEEIFERSRCVIRDAKVERHENHRKSEISTKKRWRWLGVGESGLLKQSAQNSKLKI